jgi:hypothetical protein
MARDHDHNPDPNMNAARVIAESAAHRFGAAYSIMRRSPADGRDLRANIQIACRRSSRGFFWRREFF